jgi:hypothetical protein
MSNVAMTARVLQNLHADDTLPLDLLAQLKRVTFLLSSARLIIDDQDARNTASAAVQDARAVIVRAEA